MDTLTASDGKSCQLVRRDTVPGYKVVIISGGFSVAVDRLRDSLGLDFAYGNKLEIGDDKLTGKVEGPIVDAEKKADLLAWVAHKEGIPLEQTIAIGDGANDALMLAQAGLGIAFHAKSQPPEICGYVGKLGWPREDPLFARHECTRR
jgi:phosphoserine phosphatase